CVRKGDFNQDGDVDHLDLFMIQDSFSFANPPAPAIGSAAMAAVDSNANNVMDLSDTLQTLTEVNALASGLGCSTATHRVINGACVPKCSVDTYRWGRPGTYSISCLSVGNGYYAAGNSDERTACTNKPPNVD